MKRFKQWFNGRKISQKLMLISVFFMIPDSIMLYLFITSINENVHFARLEQVGNQYQRPLETLLQLIPRQRLLARSGLTPQIQSDWCENADRIDAAFRVLAAVDRAIGLQLDFTPDGLAKRDRKGCDLANVRREWNALKTDADHLNPAARDDRYVALVGRVRAMIAHAGDMSNLILDPELDSYYLVDTTLMALPQTQDRLAQVMADAQDAIGSRQFTTDQRVTLATDLKFLKEDDLDRIVSSTNTALSNGNPLYGPAASFHTRVPPVLQRYATAAQHFDELTARLEQGGPGSVALADYLAAGRQACDASFVLWSTSDAALDQLLQNRIDYYVYRRTRSLGISACAVLAAILLVTFITRSISGPLKLQAQTLQQEIQERIGAETALRDTHTKMLALSRQAGMAEVATGVLHNVGNVLNSVNISVTMIATTLNKLRTTALAGVVDLLNQHEQDLGEFITTDPRGKKLPGFLGQLSASFKQEQQATLLELELLQKNVEHIKEVIKRQQAYASSTGFDELLDPRELIETVLRTQADTLARGGIEVVRAFQTDTTIHADKHKLLQILTNLVANAAQAMKQSSPRVLTVGLELTAAATLRVWVRDTGCGIANDHLTRIFAHGFTTKADGHGFGLHSSALAAKEMKGSLVAHSDGPGQGALFTLELPAPAANHAQRIAA